MLYHLALFLKSYYSFFNVFHYISFRSIASLLTSLILSFIFGSKFIGQSKIFRSKAREYVPDSHKVKNDTPTMGGLFIIFTTIVVTLLWCNLTKVEVWLFLLCIVGFGLIGFWDDLNKIRYNKGISEKLKFRAQVVVSFVIAILWYKFSSTTTVLCFPFFKNISFEMGLFIIFWMVFVLIGTSNAVNLTDGLDGLAIGSLLPNFVTFSIIAYVAGNKILANYLHIPFVATSELTIIGSTLIGSSLGFLWYNTYPAQIFMGDVGSLALGASLGYMAIATRQELLLIISGGLFVVETVSVIIQIFSYKIYGKKFFKMAPIHHHFELTGWPESKITIRCAIISLILCLLSLITIKIR